MTALTEIKNIMRFAAVMLLVAAVSSCLDDTEIYDCGDEPLGRVLRLSLSPTQTRAGDNHFGDDPYAEEGSSLQEEKINRVSLFFFSNEKDTGASPFFSYETTIDETTMADLTVKIPIDLIGNFADNRAYVYALANLPEIGSDKITVDTERHTVNGKPASLANLQSVWVKEERFAQAGMPGNFVMRGDGTVTLEQNSGGNATVSGYILLERLASKVRLFAGIEETIYLDENGKTIYRLEGETDAEWNARLKKETVEIWDSEPINVNGETNVSLYFYNLTTRGRIDGYLGDGKTENKSTLLGYADIDRREELKDVVRKLNLNVNLNDYKEESTPPFRETYPYTHATAYYSYPNEWDSSDFSEQHRTYVILSIPWSRRSNNDPSADSNNPDHDLYQVCYYQIPVNALAKNEVEKDRLAPNTYYRIKINIGMLGAKDFGTPLEVDASYEALDWTTAAVEVNIKNRRYLVVNQKEWTMNNVWTLEVPFSSSHEVEVEACYVNYFRYNDIWGTADNTDGEHNATEFSEWLLAAQGDRTKGYPGLSGGQNGEGLIKAREFTSGRDVPADREEKIGELTLDRTNVFGVEYRTQNIEIISHQETFSDEQQLYYKKKYFYDDIVNNYLYYVGHEHPKTYQLEYIECPVEDKFEMTKDINGDTIGIYSQKKAWDIYKDTYGMDSIYTCEIDHEKGVIRFKHPLVWWEEVRGRSEDYDVIPGRTTTGIYIWDFRNLYWLREKTEYKTYIYKNSLKYYRPVLSKFGDYLRDEFSRCEIVIKIKHKDWTGDDDLYRETVHITQYPAVYVQESHNYGNVSTSSSYNGEGNYSGGNEYVRINGLKTYDGSSTGYWEINGDGALGVTNSMTRYNGTNMNPNMYVVSISQLSEEDEVLFDLGDPRSLTNNINLSDVSLGQTPSNNLASNNETDATKPWASWEMKYSPYDSNRDGAITNKSPISAPSWLNGVKGNNRQLAYYYPTDETVEGAAGSKENFVAPVIRIASSFGKIQQLDKFEARRRCASYQEAGRPAGRWRLPTKAEVKYVAQLSAEGKIPILFGLMGREARYWTSTGIVRVDVNLNVSEVSSKNGDEAVRCVYDDWYWKKDNGEPDLAPGGPLEKDFYWGDRPKDNTQTSVQSLVRSLINKK